MEQQKQFSQAQRLRAQRSSDQNVLKTLYQSENEIVLSLLKTRFVRIFSSNDNPSSSLFTILNSNDNILSSNAIPLSHHLLELLRTQNIDICILNNHQLLDENVLREYGDVISTTNNFQQFESLNKENNVQLNNPFYVDFILKRSSHITGDDALSHRLLLGIFELEKLLFQFPPLSMSDKLISILNEYPQGIDITKFCHEYKGLFRENFIHQSELNKTVKTFDNKDKDLQYIGIDDVILDQDTMNQLQDFFNQYSEIVVAKYVPNKQDMVLFANLNQKISLNISNWIENIIVNNDKCWFNILFNSPNMLFVEYSIKSPSTLILNGRLSYLESVIQYFQWLDQVEQYTVSATTHSTKTTKSNTNINEADTWSIFISQDNISDINGNRQQQFLFDTNNYFNNNGRFKMSKQLLLYGLKQSYFLDIDNINNYQNINMENLELKHLFDESIFVHHPFDAPSPITLSKFLELQIETDPDVVDEIKSWKIPLVVENILKRKKLGTGNNYRGNQEKILNAQSFSQSEIHESRQSKPSLKSHSMNIGQTMNTGESRDIQAKVINMRESPVETTSKLISKATSNANMPALNTELTDSSMVRQDDVSIPIAIENNLNNLWKNSRHKVRPETVKKLLQLLRRCETDNYTNCIKLDNAFMGNRSKIAISEYDIAELWKSYYRTPLNITHPKLMQELIYVYYPYFEIHLVSPHTNSTRYSRYISIRDDPNILSMDNSYPLSNDNITFIDSADSFKNAVHDLITNNKNYSDGLYLSQIITKLSQSNQYVFSSSFFGQNWDKHYSLFSLLSKKDGLSTIPSLPRYDPIITAIETEDSIQDFITREVHGHDRRDGNGVALPAILSLVRAVSPNFFNSEFKSISETAKSKKSSKPIYHDDVVNFLRDIETIDLLSATNNLTYVNNLDDITIYATPQISELHESITEIINNLSNNNQETLTTIDKIAVELINKYPALNVDKYGFENDIEALIETTPNFATYKPYPLSPSYVLPTSYVTLCDAISRALTQFEIGKSILEVQLRSAVIAILNPDLSHPTEIKLDIEDDLDASIESIDNIQYERPMSVTKEIYQDYEQYLSDIPKYFSHLLQCQWNDQNKLWSFKQGETNNNDNNMLFKIRSIFQEFHENYVLLNTNKKQSGSKQIRKGYKLQVEIPSQSFQQKWDLKYGQLSFMQNDVESIMYNHPFIYVKRDKETNYIWQMQDQQLHNVRNALLLHLSQLFGNTDNKCHLNQFQELYSKIYGHSCVQLDIYDYLNKLGLKIDPETLIIDLPKSYYYHIPLSMNNLSKISYLNLSKFGEETHGKIVTQSDIDPYDSSAKDVNIVSILHRNLNGLYLKLFPLPTSSTLEISNETMKEILDGWMNRLCSKYLGHDIVPQSVNNRQLSVLQQLLAISNQEIADENLVFILYSLCFAGCCCYYHCLFLHCLISEQNKENYDIIRCG